METLDRTAQNNHLGNSFENDPFLIFLHIHKCAGMSFQRVLLNLYGEPFVKRAFSYIFLNKKTRPISEFTKSDKYYSGHFCFGAHRKLPTPATYITFLREPKKRLISLYNYSFYNEESYYHDLAKKSSIEEFLLKTAGPLEVDNGMTRFIAGCENNFFIPIMPHWEVDEQLFNKAKDNLDKFFGFVGILEHYDLSLLTFYKLANAKPQPYIPLNPPRFKNKHFAISEEDTKELLEKNKWDVALYEYAKNRLLSDAKKYLESPEKELKAFENEKRQYTERYEPALKRWENIKEQVRTLLR